MIDKETEEVVWKIYPDYPFIEANQFGEIRTKDRVVIRIDGQKQFVKGRILKQHFKKCGYMYVSFRLKGKRVYLRVHRVVATCFLPNPDNLPEVNHIDCDPKNNTVSNLEWCTHEYNFTYKEKYGKSAAEVFGRPVFAVELKTGKILRFETRAEAGRQLGISQGHISSVVKGELNQIGGYWFTEDKSEITKKKIQEIKVNMRSCPVIAVNRDTFEVFYFDSQREAACKLGIDGSHISKVVRGKEQQTCGYWFCDADSTVVYNAKVKFGDEVANRVKNLMINELQVL